MRKLSITSSRVVHKSLHDVHIFPVFVQTFLWLKTIVQNFGTFADEQTFDLTTSSLGLFSCKHLNMSY